MGGIPDAVPPGVSLPIANAPTKPPRRSFDAREFNHSRQKNNQKNRTAHNLHGKCERCFPEYQSISQLDLIPYSSSSGVGNIQ